MQKACRWGAAEGAEPQRQGIVGFAAVVELLLHHPDLQAALGLGPDAQVLCFSTEGATDQNNYWNIVWNGAFSTMK